MKRLSFLLILFSLFAIPAFTQTLATEDSVLKNIWSEAMDNSRLEQLAHELLDVIGPRLVGTPQMQKAHDWAVAKYAGWSIDAENQEWGKWRGWQRGVTHIDLLEPRVRTLEGTMLAWSPGTKKKGVTAESIIMADAADSLAFQAWLPNVKGKFVLISMPQPTGRADASWEEYALEESFEKMKAERDSLRKNWRERLKKTGYNRRNFHPVLNGSRAFVKDHPEIVENLQALFNQDNGTGRVTRISGQGFIDAGAYLGRWLARVPSEVTQHIKLSFPGMPSGGGTDHAPFVAAGTPGFVIGSLNWDYFRYTWHTNRDTYDKLVFDDLENNVILAASLAYLASEDPEKTSREKRVLPISERTGKQREWPAVREPERAGGLEKKTATNGK